jgi:hypothetical protein
MMTDAAACAAAVVVCDMHDRACKSSSSLKMMRQ